MSGAQDRPRKDELERLERDYRALADETPPELVDRAIRNRARSALEERRRAWPWTRGWAHNLATAAVVALAVTVLFQLREPGDDAPPPGRPAAPQAEKSASPAAAADEAAAAAPMAQPRPRAFEAPAGTPVARPRPRALEAPAPAPPAAAPRENAQRVAPALEEQRPDRAEDGRERSPEEWLEHILALREQGEVEAAQRALARFRAAYPAYPLPPELRE